MTTFNFSEVIALDIDEKPIDGDIYKVFANALFQRARNLDLVEIARTINKGEIVDLRPKEVNEIKQLLQDPQANIAAFARKALLDFVEKREKDAKKDKVPHPKNGEEEKIKEIS